jgi:predicted ATPase/class 3 adenylate cyclase/tetratricopeptide (TPR) repeat protein
MAALPTGTVTFLFTDIEGSTTLLQRLGDRRYAEVLADHRRLLRDAFAEGHGQEIDTQGDAFLVAFSRARDAVATAVAAQRVLTGQAWPDGATLRVRMGLHTGEPVSEADGYVGLDLHRAARICSAGHGGQILVSDAVSGLLAHDLPPGITLRDLGTHRLKDLKDPEHLFQIVHPDLPNDFPSLKTLDVHPHNLPRQLTSFIGRAKEMAEVRQLLATASLVTLTGIGGAGKTRLALQLAAGVLQEYVDGAWWVELAPLADPQLVPQTLVSTLNLRAQPGRPLIDTLVDHLQPRASLLVLDNCEHLLSACAQLADVLLRRCPRLKMLATSREGLGIAGETLYPVPSLSVPDSQRALPLGQLARYEALQLFAARAAAVLPTFTVTERNANAVAQICRRLDGIPLAVELAAARVKVLPVEQMASRLDDQFRLLTGGSRVALPRHQTLRAAMDWSHNLLAEPERAVLRRLSVFAGGWTLEAAEAVCVGEDVKASDVLDLLTRLVDKSIVIAGEQDGKGRYRLLEPIRQYARDRLLESGETEAIRRRHRDFFFALLEEASPHLEWGAGAEQVTWFDRLGPEYDNLRGALEYTLGTAGPEAIFGAVRLLHEFRFQRGYWSEDLRSLELVLSATGGTRSPFRAWALGAMGHMVHRLGDTGRAVGLLEEAIAINRALEDKKGLAESLNWLGSDVYRRGDYRRAATLFEEAVSLLGSDDKGDKGRLAHTLYMLGVVARLQGDYQRAEALCKESLTLNRAVGGTPYVGHVLDGLGLIALCRGEYEQANSLCEEALALSKQWGYRHATFSSLNSLGLIACAKGDYARATARCEEGLSLARELGDKGGVARSLNVLARVAFYRGDHKKATTLHRESLVIFRDLGEKLGIAQCLERLGIVEATSAPERAARLLSAAERIRDAIGAPLPPFERAESEGSIHHVRAVLSAPAVTAAWAEGRAMTMEQAIEYALAMEAS